MSKPGIDNPFILQTVFRVFTCPRVAVDRIRFCVSNEWFEYLYEWRKRDKEMFASLTFHTNFSIFQCMSRKFKACVIVQYTFVVTSIRAGKKIGHVSGSTVDYSVADSSGPGKPPANQCS